jgi:UDP-N-acetylglucosamine 3-dehydrogenase
MGRRHLETLARLRIAKPTAVATRSAQTRAEVAAAYHVTAETDYRQLDELVDAVVVSVPTVMHAEVASFFLERGIHVLVEKPIAATVEEGRMLIDTARRSGAILMIGHIERFNPAYMRLQEVLQARGGVQALSGTVDIHAFRMGPFDGRIQDVGVEHDLMIHDIDATLGLLPGVALELRGASGMQIITSRTDIALVQLEGSCKGRSGPRVRAQVLASRVADEKRRGLRLEHPEFQAELDFFNQSLSVGPIGGKLEPVAVEKGFSLDAELRHFVDCVKRRATPAVDGHDGLRALEICVAISDRVWT